MGKKRLTLIARKLRRNSTDAENRLWYYLRGRRFEGAKFIRQFQIGPHVADFACRELHLGIEFDGGQHTPERDARRTAHLESQGFQLMRFWNNEVLQNLDGVWVAIEQALATPPHPAR